MHPATSSNEGLPVPFSQGSDVFGNSNFITDKTHVMNLIRKHHRPKISPLLPNPAYTPAFYQTYWHNNYVNPHCFPQNQPLEKIVVQQYYQKKQRIGASQVRNDKISTSSAYKAPSNVDTNATKIRLLQSITNVDIKIAEIESELSEKKKLEAAKNQHCIKQMKLVSQPVNCSLFKKIIAENQQKALEAHSILLNLGPQLDFPVYNQPCDTAVYEENKKHYISFKEKLKMFLRKKCVARVKTQKSLLKLYSHLACKWKNNINKLENSRRHKSKEVKNRSYFETVFPELQKKKVTKERSKRTGDHVLSEADYQGILCRLKFENLEYTLLKSSSAIPPILLDFEKRSKIFLNQNNLMMDVKGTGVKEFFNLWTPIEKSIFKEKFIQFFKDFGKIASFLDKKSVGDCVKYYYLTKKMDNYKTSSKSKKMQHVMFQQYCVSHEKIR